VEDAEATEKARQKAKEEAKEVWSPFLYALAFPFSSFPWLSFPFLSLLVLLLECGIMPCDACRYRVTVREIAMTASRRIPPGAYAEVGLAGIAVGVSIP
jgi:hypothetical protein